jgi:hypothetical protein
MYYYFFFFFFFIITILFLLTIIIIVISILGRKPGVFLPLIFPPRKIAAENTVFVRGMNAAFRFNGSKTIFSVPMRSENRFTGCTRLYGRKNVFLPAARKYRVFGHSLVQKTPGLLPAEQNYYYCCCYCLVISNSNSNNVIIIIIYQASCSRCMYYMPNPSGSVCTLIAY